MKGCWHPIALMVVASLCVEDVRSSDAMKPLVSGFLKVLDQCKQELNLTDQIVSDLYRYWKQDYTGLSRETGCILICMSQKLELLDATGNLHHGNIQDYALKHGAAQDVAAELVKIIHGCENKQESNSDQCIRALEVAKCFRTGLHQLHWAPKMDVIVSEVLTEL